MFRTDYATNLLTSTKNTKHLANKTTSQFIQLHKIQTAVAAAAYILFYTCLASLLFCQSVRFECKIICVRVRSRVCTLPPEHQEKENQQQLPLQNKIIRLQSLCLLSPAFSRHFFSSDTYTCISGCYLCKTLK